MSTSQPLPIPPRTPSPLTPVAEPEFTNPFNFDPGSLAPHSNSPSPFQNNNNILNQNRRGSGAGIVAARRLSQQSNGYAPGAPSSGLRRQSLVNMEELEDEDGNNSSAGGSDASAKPVRQPFNFKPMSLPKGPINTKPNQRRGHKYKHSSVSHQIFLEPPPRAPLALPASLPIPTFTEWYRSISKEQNARILWCFGHCVISTYIWWSTGGSLAMTALSHLVLFDALSAILCVCVDVLGNFEVWKRSSLRHPFGLERVEVLAGFAMSVFLLFMGMDIMTHTAEHLLENWSESEIEIMSHSQTHPLDHTDHAEHARISPGSVDLAALLAIVSTLLSAFVLRNHARIGHAMRFNALDSLPSILSNPAHFLTLSCAGILLLLPLLSINMFSWLDRGLAVGMSIAMIVIGIRLVKTLGSMLLMSYGGHGVAEVIKEIEMDSSITSIQEASFWQVHHNLCMANLKLCAKGVSGAGGESRLRERISRLVKDRLGGPYGKRSTKWEVSIAIEVDQ